MRRGATALTTAVVVSLLGPGAGAATASASASPAGNPCKRPRPRLLCPDLLMSAPSALHLDRRTRSGRVLLRATSSIDNHGRGPLELAARRLGRHRWHVYQAIYDRRGRRHLFLRRVRLVYKLVPGARYGFGNVGPAAYWKMKHAAGFQLWSLDSHLRPVSLVRVGPKVDYCLRDLDRTLPLAASPLEPVYPACSRNPVLRHDRLGTSVGWSDVYPYSYPEQWIDVTGLRGSFAFVQIVDPDHLLIESSRANDVSETYVSLPSGRMLGRRVAVSRP